MGGLARIDWILREIKLERISYIEGRIKEITDQRSKLINEAALLLIQIEEIDKERSNNDQK